MQDNLGERSWGKLCESHHVNCEHQTTDAKITSDKTKKDSSVRHSF